MNEGRRTQAMRGPGAGGFTPAASLAASNPCLNCGTNIQLTFCPECGQREIEPDPSLREFVRDAAEQLLGWDGKLARTFRMLLTRPGELTKEYLAGRRVRYLSPLRVYLVCSLAFFALNAVIPRRQIVNQFGQRVEEGIVQVSPSTAQELAQLEASANQSAGLRRVWMSHMARALRSPAALQHTVSASIPKAMFVLVPLFAALIGMTYSDRRRRYPQHLAFALHVHAVLFLMLTLALLGVIIPWSAGRMVYQALLVVPLAWYLVRSVQNVYESRLAQSIGRLALACGMYFIAFLGAIGTVFALTVLTY